VGVLKVVNEGGSLALVLPSGGSGHAIFARSEEDLFIPDLGVPIKFLKGPHSEVTHLRVTLVERDVDAPRVPK